MILGTSLKAKKNKNHDDLEMIKLLWRYLDNAEVNLPKTQFNNDDLDDDEHKKSDQNPSGSNLSRDAMNPRPAAMVRFKQTARKTCDADAYVRAQQSAHSSSSSGSDDTIAFSVYAELRREFDMLQGKYDRLIDRLKNVYPDSRNYEGKPKEQMIARLETLVQYVNTKLEEMPAHRDRTSQYVIQMVADELQSIVKTLREEKTTKPRSDGVEP
ncbi:hypothetical protein AgCh_012955 [Apium graveolens]